MPMRRVKRRLLCAEPRGVVCKPAILLQRPGQRFWMKVSGPESSQVWLGIPIQRTFETGA